MDEAFEFLEEAIEFVDEAIEIMDDDDGDDDDDDDRTVPSTPMLGAGFSMESKTFHLEVINRAFYGSDQLASNYDEYRQNPNNAGALREYPIPSSKEYIEELYLEDPALTKEIELAIRTCVDEEMETEQLMNITEIPFQDENEDCVVETKQPA